MRVGWGALAAATVIALSSALPAAAAPAAMPTLHPGTPLVIGRDLCTAGFAVRNPSGTALMITAGHCNAGGPVKVESTAGSWLPAADFAWSNYSGNVGDDADIAVITPNRSVAVSSAVDSDTPIGGPVSWIADGMTLCKQGAATGRSCGPVIMSSASKVKFAARIAPGDSGGPVWGYTSQGGAFAVGITIRQSDSDGYAIAELIYPWLQRLQLSMD